MEEIAAKEAAEKGDGKKKKKNKKKNKDALAEYKDDDAVFFNFTEIPLAE